MKRLESNLQNMVLSLTVVTLVAAAVLGGLYVLTEKPIAEQKAAKQQQAITSVLPKIEGIEPAEPVQIDDNTTIYRAFANGEYVGAAVQTAENGFGGVFHLMVGFDKDGNVVNYEVLDHQETPGLGDHMTDWFKTNKKEKSSIKGRHPVKKFVVDGNSTDEDHVDAITAATISSKAFLSAINNAYNALNAQETVNAEDIVGDELKLNINITETEELKEVNPDAQVRDNVSADVEPLNENKNE